MTDPSHLPADSLPHSIKRDFAPYPRLEHGNWLDRLLAELTVRGVTAIHYRCTRHWRMAERRIGDDMFFYITRGRGTIVVEGRSSPLRPGIAAHFRRGQLHSATTDPRDPIHVIALHYTATVYASLTLPEVLNFPDVFDTSGDSALAALFEEACREYACRPAGSARGLEAITMRILLHLIRHQATLLAPEAPETRLAYLHRLLPALQAMRQNLEQAPYLPDLARRAGLSEPHFRRLFQRTLGCSPVQYLRRIRVEHACHLLRQTNATVESIAARVGYAEPAFFAHSFKKLIGMSPGRFRQTHEL